MTMAIGEYLRLKARLEADVEACGCGHCKECGLFIAEAEKLREAAKDAYDEGYEDGGTDMEEELDRDARDPDADRPIELSTLHKFFTALRTYVGWLRTAQPNRPDDASRLILAIEACRGQLETALEVDAKVAVAQSIADDKAAMGIGAKDADDLVADLKAQLDDANQQLRRYREGCMADAERVKALQFTLTQLPTEQAWQNANTERASLRTEVKNLNERLNQLAQNYIKLERSIDPNGQHIRLENAQLLQANHDLRMKLERAEQQMASMAQHTK